MEYRSVLEVVKLITAKETLVNAALVNAVWASACDSDELWIAYTEDHGFCTAPSPHMSAKFRYRHVLERSESMPLVRHRDLTLFHCASGKWGRRIRLRKSIKADEVSASAMLPDGSTLCCGGGNWRTRSNWANVYRIEDSGDVRELRSMQFAREAHGIICVRNAVYVFGGDSDAGPPIMSGEKLPIGDIQTLQTRNWSLLPNMLYSHSYFTPVLFQSVVYLCGGYSSHLETFSPATEQFTAVPLALAQPEHSWCAVYQQNLVIVSGYRMHVLRNADNRRKKLHRMPAHFLDEWSQSPPVMVGDVVFRLALNGDILETNLSTHEEGRVKRPRSSP